MRKTYAPTLGAQRWQTLLADFLKHWRTSYSARALAHYWEAARMLKARGHCALLILLVANLSQLRGTPAKAPSATPSRREGHFLRF